MHAIQCLPIEALHSFLLHHREPSTAPVTLAKRGQQHLKSNTGKMVAGQAQLDVTQHRVLYMRSRQLACHSVLRQAERTKPFRRVPAAAVLDGTWLARCVHCSKSCDGDLSKCGYCYPGYFPDSSGTCKP